MNEIKPLRVQLEELNKERAIIVNEKIRLTEEIKELGISKNIASMINRGVLPERIEDGIGGDDVINKRKVIVKEVISLEKKLALVNQKILSVKENIKQNNDGLIREVCYEIFNQEQWNRIIGEVDRRSLGLEPIKVSIDVGGAVNNKNLYEKYKQLAKESIDKLIAARKSTTKVIDEGMKKFDKGYFLQVISPLNKELPTVIELEKTKRLNHL
jgi:hypothetical protein